MMLHARSWLAGMLSAGLMAGLAPTFAESVSKSKTIPLSKRTLRAGTLRPGWGVQGKLPGEAWGAKVGEATYLFLDLNGDGELTADGRDGFAIPGIPFVVPLPEELLLPVGQCKLTFGAEKVRLDLQPLHLDAALLAEAADMTELRLRAGLTPLKIDDAACQHCALHCEYLRRNPDQKGMDLHNEGKNRPGYTPEGARAGGGSCLYPSASSFRAALQGWYRTAWHGAPIVDPTARAAGVMFKNGIAMFYPLSSGRLEMSCPHPADGATGMPLCFNPGGEIPNPLPAGDTRSCGFPVFLRLAGELQGAVLTSAALVPIRTMDGKAQEGRPIKGTFSCPHNPATPSWPSNSGLALFVPSLPLEPNTAYRARFTFQRGDPIEWTFRTGSR